EPGVDADLLTAEKRLPQRKYGVNADYHLPLAAELGDVSLRANWSWQSAAVNGVGELSDISAPGGISPAYGMLNLAADWNRIGNSSLDMSLYVSNATNKVYEIGGLAFYNFLGFTVQRYGEPRMYGLRLRYRFGAKSTR
ncbi:MAG TPA: hypothetical protein VHB68_00975, partial [Steroidobacteraceae bacterium]|nr:hypothetical protein [Steroidobacteraceae bacterium]